MKNITDNNTQAIKETKDGIYLYVKIKPNASNNEIKEITDKNILINIKETPIDNKANKELVKFLAKKLKIAKRSVKIIKGLKSKDKILTIADLDNKSIKARLF